MLKSKRRTTPASLFLRRRIFWRGAFMNPLFRVLLMGGTVALAACQGQPQLGQGGSVVSGSGGSAGAQGASEQMVHCAGPIGTAALVEPDAQVSGRLSALGLQSPIPLMRLIMAQSNCFRVVDRGAA